MNDEYVQTLRDMAALTKSYCTKCTTRGEHCCSPLYGEIVVKTHPKESKVFPTGDSQYCQFLLKDGCSVPPEYRPLCSIHYCVPGQKFSMKFKHEYAGLLEKVFKYIFKKGQL
jgi:hypothetical protein